MLLDNESAGKGAGDRIFEHSAADLTTIGCRGETRLF